MPAERVLFVDDDTNLTASVRRQFRNDFQVEVANSGEEGIDLFAQKGPFAVVVSDMRMGGMSGNEFLGRIHQINRDTARILLTGYADVQTAIESVNRGHVFRFLSKPCPPDDLKASIKAAIDQYRTIKMERELLETTVHGSVKVLSDVISLCSPRAFGKTARVRKLVKLFVDGMKIDEAWKFDVAAMLALVGCVSIPEPVLIKMENNERTTLDEDDMIRRHPRVGHQLIGAIPRLQEVAEFILYQNRRYDGWDETGLTFSGKDIPLGARMIKLATDYDSALQRDLAPRAAYLEMEAKKNWYDPNLLAILKSNVAADEPAEVRSVKIKDLRPGMILKDGLVNKYKTLLIADGLEVTPALQSRINNMASHGMIIEPFDVFIPAPLALELAEDAAQLARQRALQEAMKDR